MKSPDTNPIPDYLEFLSSVVNGILKQDDEGVRNATKEAAELATRSQDTGLTEGLRAHVILNVFRQQSPTGFENHFMQWTSAVRVRKSTKEERKRLRPVRQS